jgi:glycosyltransferase involved in cell wall biosynthesis
MMTPLPILHLRSTRGLYGAERALLTLAARTPAPFSPCVVSIVRRGLDHALADAAESMGLEALRLDSDSRTDAPLARAVAAEVFRRGVRLLHAHDFKALGIGLLAAGLTGVPLVATYHGDTGASLKLMAYEGVGRLLGNFARGVAAVSRPLAARLQRWVPGKPVVHIPNGIVLPPPPSAAEREAARMRFGLSPGESTLAVVGRLSPEKGHAVLFEALRTLARPPTLLIAGEGPLRSSLERGARGLPVHFLGYLDDTRPVLAASDAVVMPSLTEGLPLTALEALAAGRWLIASRMGELPELLQGGAGALVPAKDVRALAAALQQVREDPTLSQRAAELGPSRVRAHYSGEAMARAYAERLYSPCLAAVT